MYSLIRAFVRSARLNVHNISEDLRRQIDIILEYRTRK